MAYLNGDACRVTLKTGAAAAVFFDEQWCAWAYSTEDLTNGPYETVEEAVEALIDDVGEDRLSSREMHKLTHLRGA